MASGLDMPVSGVGKKIGALEGLDASSNRPRILGVTCMPRPSAWQGGFDPGQKYRRHPAGMC
jgi:hypothetical protein